MNTAENVDVNDKREWSNDEEKLVSEIVEKTEDWSFAFLKELYVNVPSPLIAKLTLSFSSASFPSSFESPTIELN